MKSQTSQAEVLTRKVSHGIAWTAPGIVLMALPKCPICLAGYVAAATGLGLSISSASWLRTGLIVTSIAALVVMTARQLRRVCK